MRRAALVLVLTGCGGFLPFFGDDDDPAPPPPPPSTADAASDVATPFDASDASATEAASDGSPPLFWNCTTQPPSQPYATEDQCNGGRLGEVCDPNSDLPIGVQCESFGMEQTYCPQVCQKTGPGASTYSYTLTICRCQP